MSDNFATKDQELAEKLQNDEGCTIINVHRDPTDGLKEFTFEESKSEISKILGVKVAEEETEVLPEVKKKKAGRPKKRR